MGYQFRHAGSWAGAYYVQAPKTGTIFTAGNVKAYTSYPVNPEWVMNMVQAKKISYKDAHTELVHCAKGCIRRLADLDKWNAEMKRMRQRLWILEAQDKVAQQIKPCLRLEAVDNWLQQYRGLGFTRKKFLVLEGGSGLGKSEFVRQLFPPGKLLELNCGSTSFVNLRDFDWEQHEGILFDEATPSLVARERKVFQCPPVELDLGHSPTGRDVYKVFINGSLLVISTNRWRSELDTRLPEDREWVVANSVYVHVTAPLWDPS